MLWPQLRPTSWEQLRMGARTSPSTPSTCVPRRTWWGHQGAAAATEFQKILDHPGEVVNEPIGALAHLGLVRAYALEAGIDVTPVPHAGPAHAALPIPSGQVPGGATPGALAKARAAYQDFFALWKYADPDIPVLKQAKAEYARLGASTSAWYRARRARRRPGSSESEARA
jgi:hypothetical protein